LKVSNLQLGTTDTDDITVAPHYFKPADLEQLASGDKKMPKAIGASSATATPS